MQQDCLGRWLAVSNILPPKEGVPVLKILGLDAELRKLRESHQHKECVPENQLSPLQLFPGSWSLPLFFFPFFFPVPPRPLKASCLDWRSELLFISKRRKRSASGLRARRLLQDRMALESFPSPMEPEGPKSHPSHLVTCSSSMVSPSCSRAFQSDDALAVDEVRPPLESFLLTASPGPV